MNKKKSEEIPLPEHPVEGFGLTLKILYRQMGIEKYPQVKYYVDALVQACDRCVSDVETHMSPKKKIERAKRQFIQIWKTRYLQLTDFEFIRQIDPTEGKMIRQLIEQLMERGFSVEEYLKWLFQVWLPENSKFCPPQIKQMCSAFVVERFYFEHKDEMRERQRKEMQRNESIDLISRARVLLKIGREIGAFTKVEAVRALLCEYKDKKIMTSGLREKIEEFESESARWKADQQPS